MSQYAIMAILVITVTLSLVAFAWFLRWRDNREMDNAQTEIHHVKRGALNGPYNSVQW